MTETTTGTEPPSDRTPDDAAPLAAAPLEEVDPQERALDELAEYLAGAGVVLADLAAVEASLEPAVNPAAAVPAASAPDAPRRRPARAAARSRDASAAAFEAAGASLRGDSEVVLSADRLSAVIRRVDATATLKGIATALKYNKVRYGVQVDAIKQALSRARRGEDLRDVLVARGDPPHPGRDARFEWAVQVGGRAGTILEDGSIDLRDRRLIAVVGEGELLGRRIPAATGENGRDVTGRTLAPPAVAELEVVPGAHVRAEDEAEGVVAYYAQAQGGVTHDEAQVRGRQRLQLAISAVSRIEGDVDYTTGHVDFDGDVAIDGTVRSMFRVRATGTVTIAGNVETGARLVAGGDLLVAGGVVGADTELAAGGKVMAKFLQSCKVRAGGDVEVGAYVFEASVRCRGTLKVAGMGEGSGRALVGGLAWAARGIETPSLGSPSNPHIRLVVGIDPDLVAQADKLRARARTLEKQEAELLQALGVERFDPVRIRGLLMQTADPETRARQLQRVKKLTQVAEAQKVARERLEQIAATQREQAAQAGLTVTGTAFPGAELRLGEHILRLAEEARAVRYRLVEEEGESSIRALEA